MTNTSRVCGSCSACCRAMAVHELGKNAWQTCKHLGVSGCGIYAHRPESCRTFSCQWLRGLLEADGSIDLALRPDVCGVIFDYQPDGAFGEIYTAWEVEPGAAARGRALEVIEGLAERFPVMIVGADPDLEDGSSRRFVHP